MMMMIIIMDDDGWSFRLPVQRALHGPNIKAAVVSKGSLVSCTQASTIQRVQGGTRVRSQLQYCSWCPCTAPSGRMGERRSAPARKGRDYAGVQGCPGAVCSALMVKGVAARAAVQLGQTLVNPPCRRWSTSVKPLLTGRTSPRPPQPTPCPARFDRVKHAFNYESIMRVTRVKRAFGQAAMRSTEGLIPTAPPPRGPGVRLWLVCRQRMRCTTPLVNGKVQRYRAPLPERWGEVKQNGEMPSDHCLVQCEKLLAPPACRAAPGNGPLDSKGVPKALPRNTQGGNSQNRQRRNGKGRQDWLCSGAAAGSTSGGLLLSLHACLHACQARGPFQRNMLRGNREPKGSGAWRASVGAGQVTESGNVSRLKLAEARL